MSSTDTPTPSSYSAPWLDRTADTLLLLRNRHFLLLDTLLLLVTPALALALRLDGFEAISRFSPGLTIVTLSFILVKLPIFYAAKLYRRFWRFASIDELAKITLAVLAATVAQAALFFFVLRPLGLVDAGFPRSVAFLDGLLTLILIGGPRYSVRLAHRLRQRSQATGERVFIFGAGEAGVMIANEMRSNPHLGLQPIGFIDDAEDKRSIRIHGLDVLGDRFDIPALANAMGVKTVVIAIPTAPGKEIREIASICSNAGLQVKTMPGVYELLSGHVSVRQLREVQMEDLLRRPPIEGDMDRIEALVQGRRVLVTGAGGSIGSELCRQIASLEPSEIILLGHGENSIFGIERELLGRFSKTGETIRLHAIIADIRDADRLDQVFGLFRPDLVFHAAAHKHVPLMEANVEDAVSNNVMGTRNVLEQAEQHGVERFIMISTDKAVNPTSIMGATKRVAELLVREAAARTGRAFVAVRFGNVLGSRGSVLHIFRDQIEKGGPITVTHPDVRRYFMTIPEAVHLVLEAATLGEGSEVFLLDMGEPVRIVDLARDLLALCGKREGRDIDIVFSGLRPGEKLFEELARHDESLGETAHDKVLVCRQDGEPDGTVLGMAEQLIQAAQRGERDRIPELLAAIVPEYTRGDETLSPTSVPTS